MTEWLNWTEAAWSHGLYIDLGSNSEFMGSVAFNSLSLTCKFILATPTLYTGFFTMKSDDMCTDPQLTPCAKSSDWLREIRGAALQGSGGRVAGDEAGYYHLREMVAKRSRSNRSEETAVLRDPSYSNPYQHQPRNDAFTQGRESETNVTTSPEHWEMRGNQPCPFHSPSWHRPAQSQASQPAVTA